MVIAVVVVVVRRSINRDSSDDDGDGDGNADQYWGSKCLVFIRENKVLEASGWARLIRTHDLFP